eukprot:s132_g31.t1
MGPIRQWDRILNCQSLFISSSLDELTPRLMNSSSSQSTTSTSDSPKMPAPMACCGLCAGKASLRLAQHEGCPSYRCNICSDCLRDCFILEDGTEESSGLPIISCPHCGERSQVLETAPLKRLRRSMGPAVPVPAPLSDWEVLGLAEGSSRHDISRAYRKLALTCHPDKQGGTEASFLQLTAAHDRLVKLAAVQEDLRDVTSQQEDRAKALQRIVTDVAVNEWHLRLREESTGTLKALRAQLEGRAVVPRDPAQAAPQPICNEEVAEKPKRAMLKGIVTQFRRGRMQYHVRMSYLGMVIQTEETSDLEEAVRLRSEIVRLKTQGDEADSREAAHHGFAEAAGIMWFTFEAGNKFRNTTPATLDIERAIRYGQRLRSAASKGKDSMLKEQQKQRDELNAVRRATAKAGAQLHGKVVSLLVPRPVLRRLTGKQRPPEAYLALADGVADHMAGGDRMAGAAQGDQVLNRGSVAEAQGGADVVRQPHAAGIPGSSQRAVWLRQMMTRWSWQSWWSRQRRQMLFLRRGCGYEVICHRFVVQTRKQFSRGQSFTVSRAASLSWEAMAVAAVYGQSTPDDEPSDIAPPTMREAQNAHVQSIVCSPMESEKDMEFDIQLAELERRREQLAELKRQLSELERRRERDIQLAELERLGPRPGHPARLDPDDFRRDPDDLWPRQTRRTWKIQSWKVRTFFGLLVLYLMVMLPVKNFQFVNDPPHPESFHQWLPWLYGPGLAPEALVWSAQTHAIILPVLGALGTAPWIWRVPWFKVLDLIDDIFLLFLCFAASSVIFLVSSSLEMWSWSAFKDPPTEELQNHAIFVWWMAHFGPLFMSVVRIAILGWLRIPCLSCLLWLIGGLIFLYIFPTGEIVHIGRWSCWILALGMQAWAFWAAAEKASQFREFWRQVDRHVFRLRCAAVLSMWHAVYMPLAVCLFIPMFGFAWNFGFDAISMFVTVHAVRYEGGAETWGGLTKIGFMSAMERLQGKRIAFPGKVNPDARDCIVSFPGKYSQEWDAAVEETQGQSSLCSLACVFLTDKQSGLGGHVENPEGFGNCFCPALYGQVDPGAYLSIVEDPYLTQEKLLFKKSDAEAMGQVLLIRQEESDVAWSERKKEALLKAIEKCKENHYRAPWGCQWFAEWKENVDKAHQRGQKFHVFYFQGKVGCGKMAWEDLNDETKLQAVRAGTGLGKSQTAEVAWLDRLGLTYEEHDVSDFYRFIAGHQNNNRESDIHAI